MQQQQQYRDPPPYPGPPKQQLQNQAGLRQSFSGSETSTDVSVSSMENLSTTQRQEPQGEETHSQAQNLYTHLDLNAAESNYSILARLGMPTTTVELKHTPVPACLITGPPQGNVYTVFSETSQGNVSLPQWSQQVMPPSSQPATNNKTMEYNQNLISSYRTIPTYVNSHWSPQMSSDQSSSTLISYLANLPPPPEYPGPKILEQAECHKSNEVLQKTVMSSSHSDLLEAPDLQSQPSVPFYLKDTKLPSPQSSEVQEVDPVAIAARTSQMIEILSEQNRKLREELDVNYKKVSKLQKFETEIQKVHEAYEALVHSSEKRERLEAAMKKRLEEEIKKIRAENAALKELVQSTIQDPQKKNYKTGSAQGSGTLRKYLPHTHREDPNPSINIIDTSFSTEQDEEKLLQSKKIEQLQKSFMALQAATERRESMERQLRAQLEKELASLRDQEKLGWKRLPDADSDAVTMAMLRRMLCEKEAKIMELEAEVAKWEQRHLEEATFRQFTMEESVGSKDMRLAALEKTSADTEKLIDEAKSEKLKHIEELYQATRKVTELEAKVKSLKTQLSEKEAMVKVYQRSPMTRSSSVHTIYCSPLHSPRPSVISTASLSRQSSQSDTYRDFSTIKHVKTGSTSAIDTRPSVEDELREKFKELQTESKDDPEEDGKLLLWQV